MNKCLFCYKEILNKDFKNSEYHKSCSLKFYGSATPPILNDSQQDIYKLAENIIKSQRAISGVQPKLSLSKIKDVAFSEKFTIVGLWGKYILKPQTSLYPQLPQIEDLTMHLAHISNILTVEHALIRLKSGELAYITKRIDRIKKRKLHMEDMCQLTERLTEHKYNGSHEQIGKVIRRFSQNPGLDIVNFYELVLFCFLTGNNDMHLKNFSLLKRENQNYTLCPAYDLVALELIVEGDDEELALNLNGKKKNININDFYIAMKSNGLNEKSILNIFDKFRVLQKSWVSFIENSFISDNLKENYRIMINKKFIQIELG